jgi:GLPGLI family protein
MMTSNTLKSLLTAAVCCMTLVVSGQITAGKIIFERKTNLFKKFTDEGTKQWLGEKNKIRIEQFELFFNDSVSLFRPIESDLKDELEWATSKNTVYQNLNSETRLSILSVWGENIYIQDSTIQRTWKMTESHRKIGKYDCRKAIWEVNDSTRIYAWYADEIIPTVGPETFSGLPGAILGLATEDGGVIYFAKSVEVMQPDFTKLVPVVGKNKVYKTAEIRAKLEKDFGGKPWGKTLIRELFMW